MKTSLNSRTLGCFGLVAGLVLLPLAVQAANNSWTNTGDGEWRVGSNWTLGTPPDSGSGFTYITNANSKTVTIDNQTEAAYLTIGEIQVEGRNGETNTLLISSNTTPLVIVTNDKGIGAGAGTIGAMVLNSAQLVTTNITAKPFYAGLSGKGLITMSNNSTWVASVVNFGWYGSTFGSLDVSGGTNIFSGSGASVIGGNVGSGALTLRDGVFISSNMTFQVGSVNAGNIGWGTVTNSGATWIGTGLAMKNGSISLSGGATNSFTLFNMSSGTLHVADAFLVTTNAASNLNAVVTCVTTVSTNSRWEGNILSVAGANASFTLDGGTCSLLAKTDGVTMSAGGRFLMKSGQFDAGDVFALKTAPGQARSSAIVSNGTLRTKYLYLGNTQKEGSELTIAGGQVTAATVTMADGDTTGSSNNTVLVTGGVLDSPQLIIKNDPGFLNNVISNSGGVYQFGTTNMIVTPALGVVAINGGTISFRDVTNVNVKCNWSGSQLVNMTFADNSLNAFRLNNATNGHSGQDYTFDSTLGATNYYRLELVNNSLYRGGAVTIGSGGSLLVSNGVSTISSNLTNSGTLSMGPTNQNSTLMVGGNMVINSGSTNIFNLTASTNDVIDVGGTLTINGGTLVVRGPAPASGSVKLINTSGAVQGTGFTSVLPEGIYSVDTSSPNTITLRVGRHGSLVIIQ